MTELKTRKNQASVQAFLDGIENEKRRKQALKLYIMGGFRGHEDLMSKLGKYKTGKSCLCVNKLEDIDMDALRQLVAESVAYMRQTYD